MKSALVVVLVVGCSGSKVWAVDKIIRVKDGLAMIGEAAGRRSPVNVEPDSLPTERPGDDGFEVQATEPS